MQKPIVVSRQSNILTTHSTPSTGGDVMRIHERSAGFNTGHHSLKFLDIRLKYAEIKQFRT
jgi:hypothetical protein